MTREDRGKIREDGKEGVRAGPEARFETGRELKEAEGGGRREGGRREGAHGQVLLSLLAVGAIAVTSCMY